MYDLEQKIYFWGLVVLPVLFVVYVVLQLWKRRVQQRFITSKALDRFAPGRSGIKLFTKFLMLSFFFFSVCVALVNPKIGTKPKTVNRKGADVVFAVDVSKSMNAEDISPSRIEKAKHIVSKAMMLLNGDRLGVIVYAAGAYSRVPITTDYSAARIFLSTINTDLMSSQGTAVNEAIDLASTFYDDSKANRLLFIISDGEDHVASYNDALKRAVGKGIKVFTIGLGTIKGAPIPVEGKDKTRSYKRDIKGEVVISRLDENVLKNIAKRGKGGYINGTDTGSTLNFIKNVLDDTEKTSFEVKEFSDYKDQFQWFLGLGILFLVLDMLFLDRKTKWIQKLNLFNERV